MERRAFADRRGDLDVESVGPFESYPVVMHGWTVPHLEARYTDEGQVYVTLDGRFGIDLPADQAGFVLSFLADAIAVAKGYACHPGGGRWEPETDGRIWPWFRLSPLPPLLEEDE